MKKHNTRLRRLKNKRRPPRDVETRLLILVGEYTKKLGGSVIISGPIKIGRYPINDRKFEVAIECFGSPPPKKGDNK